MYDPIPIEEVGEHLSKRAAWDLEGGEIVRTLEFESFPKAIDFVNKLAEIAEEANHHPDIDIRYSKVTLRLMTHSKNALTQADFTLAQRIDSLVD